MYVEGGELASISRTISYRHNDAKVHERGGRYIFVHFHSHIFGPFQNTVGQLETHSSY